MECGAAHRAEVAREARAGGGVTGIGLGFAGEGDIVCCQERYAAMAGASDCLTVQTGTGEHGKDATTRPDRDRPAVAASIGFYYGIMLYILWHLDRLAFGISWRKGPKVPNVLSSGKAPMA